MKNIKNKGISLLEILIVISIISIITAIVIPSFSNFRREQEHKNTMEDLISLLNEARNNTISSKNSNNYGVHLQSDKAVLFEGSSYDENDSNNKEIIFDPSVLISGTTLNGGGSNIIFNRLTGETLNYGIILLGSTGGEHGTQTTVISVFATGLIKVY